MIKAALHRALRLVGLDVVRVDNIEAEIRRREAERQEDRLRAIAEIRACARTPLSIPLAATEAISNVSWVSADELLARGRQAMLSSTSVLDIGCAFRPQEFLDAPVHICCEPHEEYLSRLIVETSGNNKFVYVATDLIGACELFPAASVDSIFLLDVIEHIDRSIAVSSITRLQQIARRQVIIFTPIGFMLQESNDGETDQWGMHGAEWQRHHSGWTPDDYPAVEGWQVIACRDFHRQDGYGQPLDVPVGAMWAIWTRRSH
jgi:hypothetical protein